MKKLTWMAGFIMASNALANLHLAPPALNVSEGTAVFVDFIKVESTISYDVGKRTTTAVSKIRFEQKESGFPIFDLVNSPEKIILNQQNVDSSTTSMNGISSVRYLKKDLAPGIYDVEIENSFSTNVVYSGNEVKSAFWMSDLSDRRYIEQYLPTNLEFDQYQSQIEYKILGSEREHVIYTNGTVQEIDKNHWQVTYPEVYTASSYFFHLTPKGIIPEQKAIFESIDGRKIPVTVYSQQSTSRFMNATLEILKELERDYGAWPHAQVIVYGAGMGGMEHCGATITSFSALGHELIHSYFARGVMPAHGNSGWVDEAIASWRDANYASYSSRSLSRTRMAAHSEYQRTTDRDAYTKGMRFIGYLNSKFNNQESFKTFLRSFFQEQKFKPFKTEDFKAAIELFYNDDVSDEFNTYIYGKNGIDQDKSAPVENPFHPRLSPEQLLQLL